MKLFSSVWMFTDAVGSLPTGFSSHYSCPATASIFLRRASQNLCVKFSSHNVKKKTINYSEWPDRTDRKTAFCPLPCQMAGYNLPHFVAISCYLFIAKISFLWRIVNVNILMSPFSIHCVAVQVPLVLTQMSHHLSWTVLLLKSFDMPSMFSPTVSKQLIFFFVGSLTSFRKEKKLSKYNLWPCLSVFSLVLSLWCELLSSVVSNAVSCVVCPSPSRLLCHTGNIGVTKFVNFYVKTLVLLGNIQCENYPSLELCNHLVTCQLFLGIVKFLKCLFIISNTSYIFHSLS